MLRACKWYQGTQTILSALVSKEVVDFGLKYDHSFSQWRWRPENAGGMPGRRAMSTMPSLWCPFNGKKMLRAWKLVPLTLRASTLTFNIHSTNISLSICLLFFNFYFLYPWDADKLNTASNLVGRERDIKIKKNLITKSNLGDFLQGKGELLEWYSGAFSPKLLPPISHVALGKSLKVVLL